MQCWVDYPKPHTSNETYISKHIFIYKKGLLHDLETLTSKPDLVCSTHLNTSSISEQIIVKDKSNCLHKAY